MDYKYYLKRCGFQELGSVGIDGKVNRGRYLLTSMNEEVLSFFPPLSITQLNDYALLPVIPLYSGKKVYCNYVYHNDKFHNSTAAHKRNEYRIYLNKTLEENKLLFHADDIMVMRKDTIDDEDGDPQIVYLLDLVQDHQSMIYKALNSEIGKFPTRGGYGIYNGVISEFESKVSAIKNVNEAEVVIDATVTDRFKSTDSKALENLFNASTFRDFVMVGYSNLCAITGTVIKYDNYMNLEAAHIKPKSHGGLFLPNNGMALCRDLHWAFDKGFFTLTKNLEVMVHPKTTSDYLRSFEGRQIRLPSDAFFIPNLDNVYYHNKEVYGLFLTTGRL